MIQDGKLRGFAMGHAIPVRTDYTAGEVRRFAQRAKDAAQARRLLAIAAVLDGASRGEEAKVVASNGVVRWGACDLIMRLHEEFGLSVSDDTIYRALKTLGFSHVSARPKAYRQNADAMDAFKKTSPSVWRKSVRSSHPTHR